MVSFDNASMPYKVVTANSFEMHGSLHQGSH